MIQKALVGIVFFLIFLSGCKTQEPSPPPQPQQTQEHNLTKQKPITPSLTVITEPKNARVRIMNIRPKYHPDIELKKGKYLIEVSAKGYERYKKWVFIDKPTTLQIKLTKKKNIPALTIRWKYNYEQFYTLYDPKNDLIWALQAPYIDYVTLHQPKKVLRNTIFATSKKWPQIYKTKLDTLIYVGNVRQKGDTYLFKKNNATRLYYSSKKLSKKYRYAPLSQLHINGTTHSWQLPTSKQIFENNPFQQYQKYFEVVWDRGVLEKFNLPQFYVRRAKNGFYTPATLLYTKKGGLYQGKVDHSSHNAQSLTHVALINPVRKPSSKEDHIIYNPRLSIHKKFVQLFELTHSASKTIRLLLGDPKVRSIYYDAKKQRLRATIYSSTNHFYIPVSQKMGLKQYKEIRKKLLDTRLIADVTLQYKNNKLRLKKFSFVPNLQKRQRDYKEALRLKTLNAYRDFIRLYPHSPQAKKIQKLIDKEHRKYKL